MDSGGPVQCHRRRLGALISIQLSAAPIVRYEEQTLLHSKSRVLVVIFEYVAINGIYACVRQCIL